MTVRLVTQRIELNAPAAEVRVAWSKRNAIGAVIGNILPAPIGPELHSTGTHANSDRTTRMHL
jgi:hypothetical protein